MRLRSLLTIFLLCCGLLTSTVALRAQGINDVYTILLVLDGMRHDILHQAIRSGRMPTLKQHFVRGGTQFHAAHAAFPSITTSGYVAMISGLLPGHMGLPYLEYFDREKARIVPFLSLRGRRNINRSFRNWYRKETARHDNDTIFDALRDHPTASIMTLFDRHADYTYPKIPLAVGWDVVITGKPERVNRHAYTGLTRAFNAPHEALPRFAIAGLLATDSVGHHEGTHSAEVLQVLQEFDQWLAGFIEHLKERSIWNKTYLVITSDHGMHDIKGKLDLREVLQTQRNGLTVASSWENATRDLYFGERGIGVATLAARGTGRWKHGIAPQQLYNYPLDNGNTLNIVERLRNDTRIEHVLVRGAKHAHESDTYIYTNNAHAKLTSIRNATGTRYRYTPLTGDPLQIMTTATRRRIVRNKHALRLQEWSHALSTHESPGIVAHYGHIFDDGRAGDIIIIAKQDYGFYKNKAATHGSISKADQHIPLLMRGPTIPQGATRQHAELVDLYPTMLQWFGITPELSMMDGRPLFRKTTIK